MHPRASGQWWRQSSLLLFFLLLLIIIIIITPFPCRQSKQAKMMQMKRKWALAEEQLAVLRRQQASFNWHIRALPGIHFSITVYR
jgi:hypothetical protein